MLGNHLRITIPMFRDGENAVTLVVVPRIGPPVWGIIPPSEVSISTPGKTPDTTYIDTVVCNCSTRGHSPP